MKKLIKSIFYKFFKLIYKQYSPQGHSIKTLFLYAFMQKIIGINRKVKWPVHFTSQIKSPEKIRKSDRNPGYTIGCYIDARNGIIIEENVFIGPKVSIISQNHSNTDYDEYTESNPIIIRKNCLLLTGCIILPGIELGEHTIVAAGAVVTKSFTEPNQLIGGNPAKLIKKIGDYNSKN